MYFIVKNAHLTLILISVSFLIIRVLSACFNAQWLGKKWAKVLPHIIDTLLLVSVIILMITIQQYPIVNGWLTAKLVGLFAYIILAARALRAGKTVAERLLFLLLALASISYMVCVAITKSALPFL